MSKKLRHHPAYAACTTIAMLLFVTIAVNAAAQSKNSNDTAALLASLGYPPEFYMLDMGWTERTSAGTMIRGFHLLPLDGSAAFDVYCDMEGTLLEATALQTLGIRDKNWSVRTVTRNPEINPGFPAKSTEPSPVSMAVKNGLAVPELLVAAPDIAQAENEDASGVSTPEKGVVRIGLLQELARPVEVTGGQCSDGLWRTLPDGLRVWNLELRSFGALGQRFHFALLDLPPGADLRVFDADEPGEIYGPFSSAEDFWTPTCFGEGVVLECQVPRQCDLGAVHILLDQATYNYQDVGQLAKSGSCNIDISCHDNWRTTSLGVGGIGTIGNTGVLWCTGSLITDADTSTFVPYFLTANHCIGGQSAAQTIEVYWLYQTDECGGAVPNSASVPRTTGGADFLMGNSLSVKGTDFTLLRLRQNPPAGLVYLGFHTGPVQLNSSVVCVHHPDGDFKHISFGHSINTGSPSYEGQHLQTLDRFIEVDWDQGTTEPGSSGSPLFLNGIQMIVGQLWGGLASCSLTDEPDYFGRFDVTYPLVDAWLGNPENPYDVNRSGAIDEADLKAVVAAALAKISSDYTDVNGDGNTDAVDIQLVSIAATNSK